MDFIQPLPLWKKVSYCKLKDMGVGVILALLGLMFTPSLYLNGLALGFGLWALGFALLFLSIYLIDNRFVTRSNSVLNAIAQLT